MRIRIKTFIVISLLFSLVTLTRYIVTTLTSLKVVRTSSLKHYDVLLNAYMNSGSTFTGRLLGFHRDSFYFYEPLWHISLWSYYRGNWTMCSIKTPSCRTLNRLEMNKNKPIPKRRLDPRLIHDIDIYTAQPIDVPQKVLDHVFSCNLSQIKNLVQPGVTTKDVFSGPSWDSFRRCEKLRRSFEKCLADLETVCRRAKHRVSKVLRITLGGLESLLEHNPNVKVLHLYRDPRAVIHSRIETSGHPLRGSSKGSREVIQSAKALCDKMMIDFDQGVKLAEKFPDRFRFIHYEDLVLRQDNVRKLYEFVGMKFDAEVLRHVYAIKTNEAERRDDVKEKDRRMNNALWWRTYMTFEVVKQMDTECSHVYSKLGYPVINNITQLRNLSMEDILAELNFRL